MDKGCALFKNLVICCVLNPISNHWLSRPFVLVQRFKSDRNSIGVAGKHFFISFLAILIIQSITATDQPFWFSLW